MPEKSTSEEVLKNVTKMNWYDIMYFIKKFNSWLNFEMLLDIMTM